MTRTEHEVRVQKLTDLREAGIVCYPEQFIRTHSIAQLKELATQSELPPAETLMEA
ncbi:MAG: hypothetical protein H6765_11115 [Candidatus Peribacteria bacterium]|nr:MAG: hypothetical protein H6765_11115 [Candidatus Peribacteria bacterium]